MCYYYNGEESMNEVTKVLKERRCIRSFLDKDIPEDVLNEILECGTYAPSGKNMQSATIVVVKDKTLIAKISQVNGSFINKAGLDPFYQAPVLVIVFANKNIATYRDDGAAVIMNMMNAAYSLGVDSCWIYRARETFSTDFGKELMKKWGLNDDYEGIGNVVLGYRSGNLPPAAPRKENYIIYD